MRRPSVKTSGSVSVTAASQVLIPDNPSRLALVIGIPSADVQIKLRTSNGLNTNDTPVATAADFTIKAARNEEFRLDGYTGPVAFITAATATVPVIEV